MTCQCGQSPAQPGYFQIATAGAGRRSRLLSQVGGGGAVGEAADAETCSTLKPVKHVPEVKLSFKELLSLIGPPNIPTGALAYCCPKSFNAPLSMTE